MSKYFIKLFLLYIIFNNAIMRFIPLPGWINYWDEAVFLILFLYVLVLLCCKNGRTKINNTDMKMLLSVLFIIFTGIMGNIMFGYMPSVNAVLRDIVNFSKFPLTFIFIRLLHFDYNFAKQTDKAFILFIKAFTVIMFICGIASLFVNIGMSQDSIRHGIWPYQFIFMHPTYLVLANTYILALLVADEEKNSNIMYIFMSFAVIILSMRTKGLALVAVLLFMKYGPCWLKQFKVLYWTIAIVVVLVAGYQKLELYIFYYTTSPREALYRGSLLLLVKCFPFGSGFGTFASHLSGRSGSKVYDDIYIPQLYENGELTNVLGDAGFPYYIGQFGIFGFAAFAMFLYLFYKALVYGRKRLDMASLVIFLYIGIALTTESVLVNNGTELAVIAALVDCICRQKERQTQEIQFIRGESIYEKNRDNITI